MNPPLMVRRTYVGNAWTQEYPPQVWGFRCRRCGESHDDWRYWPDALAAALDHCREEP